MKSETRVLKDMKRAYIMTLSDIARYKRQAGSITIDVAKKFIGWNYFKNTNPVRLWTYEDDGGNYSIITMDMFELQLWILENYDIDIDMLDNIEEELNYYTTIGIWNSQSE